MTKVHLRESPVSFQVVGNGPVIVLLHGFGGSHTHWEKIVPELSKHFKIILPNLGPLTLGSIQLTFSEQVELMGDFKRAIHHEFGTFGLVGISYGAALAWGMAACDDENIIENIFMINPMPPNPTRNMVSGSLRRLLFMGRWAPLLALYLLTPIAHWDFHNVASDIRLDWPTRVPTLRKIFSRRQKMLFHLISRFSWIIKSESWSPWWVRLNSISKPVTIVHGKKDRIFSDRTMSEIKKYLQQAEIKSLPEGTHLAIHSSPTEIVGLIKEFLALKEKSKGA